MLELGYPQAGHYVRCEAGIYFDAYLGVAQRLIDEAHPAFQAMLRTLRDHGLLLRREINTDDYLAVRRGVEGVKTPQELAALVNRATERAFPEAGRFRTFFSNSGAEAIEAGMKLAQRVAHSRLLARYGTEVEAELMRQLGIPRHEFFEREAGETVYADYPFFVVGTEKAFHGRTLGALQLNFSKAAHKRGFHGGRWVRQIPFNGDPADLGSQSQRLCPRDAHDHAEVRDRFAQLSELLARQGSGQERHLDGPGFHGQGDPAVLRRVLGAADPDKDRDQRAPDPASTGSGPHTELLPPVRPSYRVIWECIPLARRPLGEYSGFCAATPKD